MLASEVGYEVRSELETPMVRNARVPKKVWARNVWKPSEVHVTLQFSSRPIYAADIQYMSCYCDLDLFTVPE